MIKDIDAQQWDTLLDNDYPFLQHAFLAALENSGSVDEHAGWLPAHCTVEDLGQLISAAPCYIKEHSWGEYVFDQQWANAYQQNGLAYYPKLVCSVPFTPCTGPRLLGDSLILAERMKSQCEQQKLSGAHLLFLPEEDALALQDAGWHLRNDVQFHWSNKSYTSFNDFLAELSSSKRKKIKRERRRIEEQNVSFSALKATEIDDELWATVYGFYANTYAVRGQSPYLSREFFDLVSREMPANIVVILATHESRPVAAAICFRDNDTLYGRHWGAEANYHSLHFETCYYQGIEYCIANNLSRFDAGAQGQHKVSRGFSPITTYSAHWLRDSRFNDAIGEFVSRESPAVREYAEQVATHSPFRNAD